MAAQGANEVKPAPELNRVLGRDIQRGLIDRMKRLSLEYKTKPEMFREIGKIAALSEHSISRFYYGSPNPTVKMLDAIARAVSELEKST
jgi:hypothetical protein